MPSPNRDTSYSELLRSLVADERRFRQALQSTPAPSLATLGSKLYRLLLADLATSVSKLHRLVLADVDRFRQALQSNLHILLLADLRRFKQALQSTPTVMPSPSLVTSISNLRRLLPADVRRFRQVRSEILTLLVADLRRFRTAVGFPRPLNVKLEQMRFYASLPEGVKNTEPWYTTRFPQENISYISCEVKLRKVQRQYNRRYAAAFRYYKSDGSLLGEVRREWMIKAEWQSTWMSQGWGWPVRGYWSPGEYEVKFILDEVVLGSGRFTVVPPPPPKPPAENLHVISVRFYESGAVSQPDDRGSGFDLLKMWETIASQKEASRDSVRFPQQTTRQVSCELSVQNLLYQQRNQTYNVTAQCYTAEEKLLWEDHHDWVIKSEEQESSISWGWQTPGQWEVGPYRVEIIIDGVDFAWGAFIIE